jgi:hypothetical protein
MFIVRYEIKKLMPMKKKACIVYIKKKKGIFGDPQYAHIHSIGIDVCRP